MAMGKVRFRLWMWWRGPSARVVWPDYSTKVPPRADLHNPEMKQTELWDVPALLKELRDDGGHDDVAG